MECKLVNLMETIHTYLKTGRQFIVGEPYIDFREDGTPAIVFELYETLADGKFISTYPSDIVWEDCTRETAENTKKWFPDFTI